jgi:GNAT superfamily N-acetyltransferase
MESTELRPGDLEAAESLVVESGWNQVMADWRIFLELGQAFAVKEGGRLAATAATLPYPSGFGWISMVLVSQAFRRRGIATELLERCIASLREAGMVPVLDATPAGREVYRPLGFRDGWAITRWRQGGAFSKGFPKNVVPLEERHWKNLLVFDAGAFGCDRAPLLARLRARCEAFSCVFEEKGEIRGFLLGRDGRLATQLGPIAADSEEVAAALVQHACSRIEGPVLLDALDMHERFARWIFSQGFYKERPYTRMALDRDGLFGDPARTLAIAGPELG